MPGQNPLDTASPFDPNASVPKEETNEQDQNSPFAKGESFDESTSQSAHENMDQNMTHPNETPDASGLEEEEWAQKPESHIAPMGQEIKKEALHEVQSRVLSEQEYNQISLTIVDRLFSFLPSRRRKLIKVATGWASDETVDNNIRKIYTNHWVSIFLPLKTLLFSSLLYGYVVYTLISAGALGLSFEFGFNSAGVVSVLSLLFMILPLFFDRNKLQAYGFLFLALLLGYGTEWILNATGVIGSFTLYSIAIAVAIWFWTLLWFTWVYRFLVEFVDFINDMIIVHDRGVIEINKDGLLKIQTNGVNFDDINNIINNSNGIIQSIFGYGDLQIQTGGDASLSIDLPYCSKVSEAVNVINRMKQEYIKKRENQGWGGD